MTNKNIWVFIECYNGEPRKVALELLGKGKDLAKEVGEEIVAIVLGNDTDNAVKESVAYGADKVIVVKSPLLADFSPDAYSTVLETLINKYFPKAVLFGSTRNGGDITGILTAKLDLGIAIDCTDVNIDKKTGKLSWVRPTFDGKLMARITSPGTFPQMGAVRAGVFNKLEADYNRNVEIIEETMPEVDIRSKVIGFIEKAEEFADIESAEVIVSGGRGLGGPEGFELIKELAVAMGGKVGASRPTVDAGWISKEHQVGITGKIVSPKIYVACGISGAPPHVNGMKNSDLIIAINTDPDAPIFDIANYGIVGDLYEVLPILTEEMKKRKVM